MSTDDSMGPNPTALHVLLVEDDELVAFSLAALLRRRGHRVDVAHSGAAALAVVAASRPQVALVDLGLPDMTGCELATRFREQADLRGLRLVALTGWSDDESRRLGEAAGFTCHLVKPVDFEGLNGVLRGIAVSFQGATAGGACPT